MNKFITIIAHTCMVWAMIFLLSCGRKLSPGSRPPFRAVELRMTHYIYDEGEWKVYFGNKLFVIENDSFQVFQSEVNYQMSRMVKNHTTGELEQIITRKQNVYNYVVFENGRKTGLVYDTSRTRRLQLADRDSFLITTILTNFDKGFETTRDNYRLISTLQSGDSLTKYLMPIRPLDLSYCDTAVVQYKKGKNALRFAFCNQLDTIPGMRLEKVAFIYKPRRSETNYTRGGQRMVFEVIPISPQSPHEIRAAIDTAKVYY